MHAVWYDNRGGRWEVYYKRSEDGGMSWGTDTRLTHEMASSALASVWASGPNVHLAWTDTRDGNGEIYYKRSTDGGTTWGTDMRLTAQSNLSQCPSISASDQTIHLVWHDRRDGTPFRVYYKRSTDNGESWSADSLLTPEGYWAEYPSIWSSGPDVHVAWDDTRDLANGDIYYKYSSDGGRSWEADTRLTPVDYTSSRGPSVTAWGTTVHVLWYDLHDGNPEIYYKRNADGNPTAIIEPGDTGLRYSSPSLAVLPNPFASTATIPGHESERFMIYDVSGRAVGIFRGDRIGERLIPGVYFVKVLHGSDLELRRVVKVK